MLNGGWSAAKRSVRLSKIGRTHRRWRKMRGSWNRVGWRIGDGHRRRKPGREGVCLRCSKGREVHRGFHEGRGVRVPKCSHPLLEQRFLPREVIAKLRDRF